MSVSAEPDFNMPDIDDTETADSREKLDPRRRKLLFRSWHRGMREMDYILGQYSDKNIASMTDAQLDEYERLLEVLDRDLFKWIMGEGEAPQAYDTELFRDIVAFRHQLSFKY